MKIILIGNKGQVGHEIEKLAESKAWQTFGFDIKDLDITNKNLVIKVLASQARCDVAINAAAYTAVDKAEDEREKAFAVNSDGVLNLALACREIKIPLLHISTDHVFSGDKETPYREEDLPAPINTYGQSKLAGEKALQGIWEKHIILRTSWVFGSYGNNFVKTILRLAQIREILSIVEDQCGCPTAALDIARVLLELSEKICQDKKNWGIYNYCDTPATTWYEFAKEIIRLGGEKYGLKTQTIKAIKTDEFPTRAKRPLNSQLLVKKISENFGIVQRDWRDYLIEMLRQMKAKDLNLEEK